jgi:hypothetical protein
MFTRQLANLASTHGIRGEDGKKLKSTILKATDRDVIDSPMAVDYLLTLPVPPISQGAKAISLVRAAILTVDKERSAGMYRPILICSFLPVRVWLPLKAGPQKQRVRLSVKCHTTSLMETREGSKPSGPPTSRLVK